MLSKIFVSLEKHLYEEINRANILAIIILPVKKFQSMFSLITESTYLYLHLYYDDFILSIFAIYFWIHLNIPSWVSFAMLVFR